jgi:3-hydroxybutyryl-CoA dehydratase
MNERTPIPDEQQGDARAAQQHAPAAGANPALQLYFDDFSPGQTFAGQRRTLDERAFGLFADLTGDAHPIHYDVEYAKRTRFGERVAHGLLVTATTALGATPLSLRLIDSMVAFLEQDARFLKPVLIGESVMTEFEVESVTRARRGDQGAVRFAVRVRNSGGEPVLAGHHTYLLRARPATDSVKGEVP